MTDRIVYESPGFTSPSGSIRCYIGPSTVRCDIRERNWAPPPRPADRPGQTGHGQGIIFNVGRSAVFVCAGDTALDSGPPLAYGDSITGGSCNATVRRPVSPAGTSSTAANSRFPASRITSPDAHPADQPGGICARLLGWTIVVLRDGRRSRPWHADVAQLVAHHLAKVRVAGSNPVIRSKVQVASTPAVEWPSGEATACKAVHTGSIPVSTSKFDRRD
jgi:hypothetical protein